MEYALIGLVLLVVGGIIYFYAAGRRSGSDAIAKDVAKQTADVAQRQAEAQANAPRGKDQIIDRLRKGGGL